MTTSLGSEEIEIPRGRVFKSDGGTAEFQSELLPRYSRRTQAVENRALKDLIHRLSDALVENV